MTTASIIEDIPSIVAEEIAAAHQAGVLPTDQPSYVANRLRQRIAGSAEYTRKRPMSPAQRSAEIKRRFNGRNFAELAREFDVTQRRVRQIVGSVPG